MTRKQQAHTLRHKSDSRRDLDAAFTGRTQRKTFPFQSFSSHTSTISKNLSLQQLICKRKQKNQMHQAPGARTAQKSKHQKKRWGACIQHPVHKGKKKIPEKGQKLLKQLSTQILINLGLCCRMGS